MQDIPLATLPADPNYFYTVTWGANYFTMDDNCDVWTWMMVGGAPTPAIHTTMSTNKTQSGARTYAFHGGNVPTTLFFRTSTACGATVSITDIYVYVTSFKK